MIDSDIGLPLGQSRGAWVRLRTLVQLRWAALFGQASAIAVARLGYGLDIPLGPCLMAMAASAILNLVATFVFPPNARLGERANLAMLLFDLGQLCFLLYLTGGLHNPFALFVLGPVVVSATILGTRSAAIVAISALVLVALMKFHFMPLRTLGGYPLAMPSLFVLGHWIAISVAIVFLSVYARSVTMEVNAMTDALAATQMALAREQKLTDLSGVVAAAAHELGTPLATIKLTSAELAEELADRPELREDVQLIREQAERCTAILRSMGRVGKSDLLVLKAPISEIIREAAEPHQDRGKAIDMEFVGAGEEPEPQLFRSPAVIHGLRNLIQNAVDFADLTVRIEARWSPEKIVVRIEDDGPGFPPSVLDRIGDPFVGRRPGDAARRQRPGYEGMGLGLFIAKTLLERTGAELTFANLGGDTASGRQGRGAIVAVEWARGQIDDAPGTARAAIGPNPPISR